MRRRPRKLTHYQWKLDETQSVTFDANGAGTVTFSPGGARERWVINFIAVSVAQQDPTSTAVPQMLLYRSAAVPGNQLSGTYSAVLDSSTVVYALNMNEPIVGAFTGGDANDIGTIHIEGVRHVWGD